MKDEVHLYVGFDNREGEAYEVCIASIAKLSAGTVNVHPLVQSELRELGFYYRTWSRNEWGQRIDGVDGRPFSTDFTFTRFLTPKLHRFAGRESRWAAFCDSDFMFRADPRELFGLVDSKYAVMVVKNNHQPKDEFKMTTEKQTSYPRKNWSSLILWNTEHPANNVSVDDVNLTTGRWLHGFSWLTDELIGALPEEWNWLEGSSDPGINPKAVHFTRGVPTHAGMENVPYAAEWREYLSGSRRPVDGSGAS